MYKIFPLWKTFHLSTTTFHRLSTKKREIYTAKKPLFSRRKRFFEVYMHKSTALIIITIILYISLSNQHPLPAGEIARAGINEKKSFGINPKT